ncbi:MAG: transglycosylase domain-containing protein [Bacilli bacterium]
MKKFINKNKEDIPIVIISLITFIIGFISIGLLKSALIVGFIDIIFLCFKFIPRKNKTKLPIKKENKTKKKSKLKKRIFQGLLILILLLCIAAVGVVVAFCSYIVKNAPKFDPDLLYKQEASILYFSNGEIMTKLGTENREKISYDEIPEVLLNAIIATEDSRFYQHNGFDLARFLKASLQQVFSGTGGGASTLTMQVVKNTFTSTNQTITRKFTDIYMAIFQVEQNYTKEEIMEFYVNAPYLGGSSYGIEQACQTYFGKSAKDINLAEAAMIAGLFQAPNGYDPTRHPEEAETRRKLVLNLMYRHGYISKEEKEIADAMTIDTLLVSSSENENTEKYQGAIDTVTEEIIKETGNDPYVVPMEIYTTIDKDKQDYVNSIMDGTIFTWENDQVDAGISILDINTGALVAVGAGREHTEKKSFNNATMINRQIGSTSKPIYDYAIGIEKENWSTYKLFMDEEYSYSDGTQINNWDGKYNGLLTLRTSLAQSRNVPALKAFQENKNSNILNFVTSIGLSPEISNGIIHEAHAIGGYNGENPLSMSAAYAVLGNGGYYITPHSYTKIVYRNTSENKEKEIEKTRVISEATAYMMTSLLQSSAEYGLGSQFNIGGAIYGAKTGTSNFDAATIAAKKLPSNAVNDLWVNSVSPDYAISVWYGYDTANADYTNKINTVSHRKLFQAVAKGIYINGSNWTQPSSVSKIEIEFGTNPAQLASEFTPSNLIVTELFKTGTEPTEISTRFSKLNNVTSLKSSISKNILTLSWTAVETPDAINESSISSWAKTLASTTDGINSLISERKTYNNSYMGTIVYQIYSKDNAGNLKLIQTTADSKISFDISSTDPTTYIVKTAYTIFKNNMSDGAEVKISFDDLDTVITAELSGNKVTTVEKNATYTDQSVIVLEDLVDVTKKATITKTIKNSSNTTVTKIDTTTVGATFTITYNIKYNDFTDTLTRTVTVVNSTTTS